MEVTEQAGMKSAASAFTRLGGGRGGGVCTGCIGGTAAARRCSSSNCTLGLPKQNAAH